MVVTESVRTGGPTVESERFMMSHLAAAGRIKSLSPLAKRTVRTSLAVAHGRRWLRDRIVLPPLKRKRSGSCRVAHSRLQFFADIARHPALCKGRRIGNPCLAGNR